jgi:hypothetical protein
MTREQNKHYQTVEKAYHLVRPLRDIIRNDFKGVVHQLVDNCLNLLDQWLFESKIWSISNEAKKSLAYSSAKAIFDHIFLEQVCNIADSVENHIDESDYSNTSINFNIIKAVQSAVFLYQRFRLFRRCRVL